MLGPEFMPLQIAERLSAATSVDFQSGVKPPHSKGLRATRKVAGDNQKASPQETKKRPCSSCGPLI
jgi:hypothetical protein